MRHPAFVTLLAVALLPPLPVAGGEPAIVGVVASPTDSGWRFDVTVEHADEGWDHYADGWEVRSQDGTQLGFRELLHPHVDEQPFTRSLTGVQVPDGVDRVRVRARDSVHGWGPEVDVELER